MPSLDTTFYHSPSLAHTHTHYFGLVNIIEYSRGVALKFSKNPTYEKIDKGARLGPLIGTEDKRQTMSVTRLYLIYRGMTPHKIFQEEQEFAKPQSVSSKGR